MNPTPDKTGKEAVLAAVEEVLKDTPSTPDFLIDSASDVHVAWVGAAAAAIEKWNIVKNVSVLVATMDINGALNDDAVRRGLNTLRTLLEQARADLLIETKRSTVVIGRGQVFDYFEELRKIIETARSQLLFVDPFLDADFVSRYLSYVPGGVEVRLLGERKMTTLVPAVEQFAKQSKLPILLRSSASALHDRYVFVDRKRCHISGASFKDGATNSSSILSEITDGFDVILKAFEDIWDKATVRL